MIILYVWYHTHALCHFRTPAGPGWTSALCFYSLDSRYVQKVWPSDSGQEVPCLSSVVCAWAPWKRRRLVCPFRLPRRSLPFSFSLVLYSRLLVREQIQPAALRKFAFVLNIDGVHLALEGTRSNTGYLSEILAKIPKDLNEVPN